MRVLFVRLSSFGDVVFALPAAKALKVALPGARLAWAVEGPLAPLLEGAPYVDEILVANTRGWRKDLLGKETRREIEDFLRKGKEFAPELIVDAQGLFKSALITAAVPAARKVGFGFRSAAERINCLFTNERVDVDGTARPHVLDQMLALAEHVTGKTGFERTPDVRHLVGREDPEVDSWLEQMGDRKFAVLQPFSSKVKKEWAAGDVIAFSERLANDGIQPVLRWGPGEESRAAEVITLSKKIFSSSSPPRPRDDPRLHRAPRGARGAVRGSGHRPHPSRGRRGRAHSRPLRSHARRALLAGRAPRGGPPGILRGLQSFCLEMARRCRS